MCLIRFLAGVLLLVATHQRLHAAAPSLDAFYPPSVARGATGVVTAVGKFDAWPPRVWINTPGIQFIAETNKGKFAVIVDSNAPPGPRLVRLYNDEGTSSPRIFPVDDEVALADIEPNNHFARPQSLSRFPVTLNGRLDKNGDVDSFAITLRAGEWLEARVDSYTLMSKVDATLRLVTTNGVQLTWNHDFITLDPRLTWRAISNETVVLQVFGFAYPFESDIRLAGNDTAIYRLHIAVTNQLAGLCSPMEEKEPNDKFSEASPVELPATISAAIDSAMDEDRFRFAAAKDTFIEARIEAATFGSPLDAWLKIENASGNEVARNDDAEGSRDPQVEWKAGTNGPFAVAVGSLTHRGGNGFCYRLLLRQVGPDFRATTAANDAVLTVGATNEIKVDIKRLRGHTNQLVGNIRNLPEGATLVATNVAPKDGAISLRITAATNAPPFQGPIHVIVTDRVTREERVVPFELITRGENGYTRLLVEKSEDFWLTVRPKPAETKKSEEKK